MTTKLGLLPALALAGCATFGGERETVSVPRAPSESARCEVAKSQENPLVTEWSSAQKTNLEALAKSGAVLVEYSGCSMRVVSGCRAPGRYRWRRTTTSTDVVQLYDADELYAKLPIGAAALEPELARAGGLAVQTTVSGQLELEGFDAQRAEADPGCPTATHVVRGVAVGAFQMTGGGGGTLRASGDPASCKLASLEEPHIDCNSPVQLFLSPLPRTLARRGPPGTLRVRFVPPDDDAAWKLMSGDRELCALPCDRRVDPNLPYSYRAEAGFLRRDHVEELPDLRPFADAGEVEVRHTPRKGGRLAGGIVMTSIGGLAMLVGGGLMGAKCNDSTGGCVAGGITLGAGAILVAPGIYFIATSGSEIEVAPATLPAGYNMDGEPR